MLVPGIMPTTPAMLCRSLGKSAYWGKITRTGEFVRIDPPDKIVEQIIGMVEEWPFPPLAGVITCPTLRPDGSLLATEGHDLATGLVLYQTVPTHRSRSYPAASTPIAPSHCCAASSRNFRSSTTPADPSPFPRS
jgi:hypothetical protein